MAKSIPVNLPKGLEGAEPLLDHETADDLAHLRTVIRTALKVAGAKETGCGCGATSFEGGKGMADVSVKFGSRRYMIEIHDLGAEHE